MTGAPIPEGADCVAMIEHVRVHQTKVSIPAAPPGQFISFRGEEAVQGQLLIPTGRMIDYTGIALLAATGHAEIEVYRQPTVAILPTGDELVPVSQTPKEYQVRNSNAHSLAVQVARAGGRPAMHSPAKDDEAATRESIERALADSDLLLMSGGVSAGKYDIVETVLSQLGAEFFFVRAAIQPGQPVVFGRVAGKFFFGLPGNPNSTMVTFEIFARAAIEMLGGQAEPKLPFALGRLTEPFRHKPTLTRFLPALLSGLGDLTPLGWKGSGDVPAMTRANAFLVASSSQAEWQAGETMPVLLK
jgi:molybdopterin molybdotransferase